MKKKERLKVEEVLTKKDWDILYNFSSCFYYVDDAIPLIKDMKKSYEKSVKELEYLLKTLTDKYKEAE